MSKLKWLLSSLVALLIIHFSFLILATGFFRTIKNFNLENCQKVTDIPGPEDLEKIWSGEILISSDNRPDGGGLSTKNGAIYILNPLTLHKRNLTGELSFEFHPHGLSVLNSESGSLVYVINHRTGHSTVEVFKFSGDQLFHLRTIEDELIKSPNDILVIGFDQFFLTHDHGSENKIMQKIEAYSRLGQGFVSFYNSKVFKVVANGKSFANGLARSLDGKTLYLATMLGKSIEIFDIDQNHEIKLRKTVQLDMAPDNLSIDSSGHILIAGHSKIFDLQSHMKDHRKLSPFEVYRLNNDDSLTTLLSGDGSLISGVSVAIEDGDKYFLGSIFQDHLLVCPKPKL